MVQAAVFALSQHLLKPKVVALFQVDECYALHLLIPLRTRSQDVFGLGGGGVLNIGW